MRPGISTRARSDQDGTRAVRRHAGREARPVTRHTHCPCHGTAEGFPGRPGWSAHHAHHVQGRGPPTSRPCLHRLRSARPKPGLCAAINGVPSLMEEHPLAGGLLHAGGSRGGELASSPIGTHKMATRQRKPWQLNHSDGFIRLPGTRQCADREIRWRANRCTGKRRLPASPMIVTHVT